MKQIRKQTRSFNSDLLHTDPATRANAIQTMPVDCLIWDHTAPSSSSPCIRKISSLPIESLVYAIGKHIALGIYTLAQHFSATPSSLSIFIVRSENHSFDDLTLAIDFAFTPGLLHSLKSEQTSTLKTMGLLSAHNTPTPFPSLSTTTYPEYSPSLPPLISDPEARYNALAAEIDNPGKFGISWCDPRPNAQHSWMGANGGEFFGFGPQSNHSRVIAECGRQLEKGWYRVLSLVATPGTVNLVVECDDEKIEGRMDLLFSLLQYGGQAESKEKEEEARSLGVLN